MDCNKNDSARLLHSEKWLIRIRIHKPCSISIIVHAESENPEFNDLIPAPELSYGQMDFLMKLEKGVSRLLMHVHELFGLFMP